MFSLLSIIECIAFSTITRSDKPSQRVFRPIAVNVAIAPDAAFIRSRQMSYDVNSLEAHWMPFSANRDFKKDPRIVVKSDGMYMWDY